MLKVYEASLWPWFQANVAIGAPSTASARTDIRSEKRRFGDRRSFAAAIPTDCPHAAGGARAVFIPRPHVRNGAAKTGCAGNIVRRHTGGKWSWTLDFAAVVDVLSSVCSDSRSSRGNEAQTASEKQEVRASSRRLPHVPRAANPILVLGTAFSFVHLLDYLAEKNLRFDLPPGSRVMETGGYKNRSRSMPRTGLHQLLTERLGVPPSQIICIGMSESSSQAYDLGGWLPAGEFHRYARSRMPAGRRRSQDFHPSLPLSPVGARPNHFTRNRPRSGRR